MGIEIIPIHVYNFNILLCSFYILVGLRGTMRVERKRMGDMLLAEGAVTAEQIDEALETSKREGSLSHPARV